MNLEVLRRIPALDDLSDPQLACIARKLSEKIYDAGQIIARGHKLSDLLFLVERGNVEVVSLANGRETFLARLRPGQFFDAAHSDLSNLLPIAIRAVTPVRLLIFDWQAVENASRMISAKTAPPPTGRGRFYSAGARFPALLIPFVLVVLVLGYFLAPSPRQMIADLHYGLAGWLMARNETLWARRELKKTIALQADYAAAYNDLGYLHYQEQEWKAALDAFQEAARADPDFATAYDNLGATYLVLGQENKAVASLQQATHLDPENAQAFDHLGVALQRLDRPDEAEAAFRSALRIDARQVSARANLAALYFNLGRLAEATQQAQAAIEIDPSLGQLHVIIGADALARRDYALARSHLTQAVHLAPTDQAAQFYFALLAEEDR